LTYYLSPALGGMRPAVSLAQTGQTALRMGLHERHGVRCEFHLKNKNPENQDSSETG
jgi:hypothetical protein